MPVFLERFILSVLVAALGTVVLVNPFKFDRQQQGSLAVAIIAIAYFVGHTVQKSRKNEPQTPTETLQRAIVGIADTKVTRQDDTRTTRIHLTFQNLGQRETTAHTKALVILNGQDRPSPDQVPERLDLAPGQKVSLILLSTHASADGFVAVWNGKSILEVLVEIEFSATTTEKRRYTFRGRFDHRDGQINAIQSEYETLAP